MWCRRALSPALPSNSSEFGETRRGLRDVQLVISHAHEGLKAGVPNGLHIAGPRCRIHVLRSLLDHARPNETPQGAAPMQPIFIEENRKTQRTGDGARRSTAAPAFRAACASCGQDTRMTG
jgi:hypothetical protein